jgi:tetratricopeptide (TPR) repeat protein
LLTAAWLCLHCGSGDSIEEARSLQAAGRYAEALAILGPLVDEQSQDPEVLYLYGANQRRNGRPGLGLWALHQASLSEGWEVTAGLEFAHAAVEALDYGVAIEAATRVLEIEPENIQALVLRAEARLEDRAGYGEALADFERAMELDPENLGLRVTRAATLLLLDRVDEAGELIAQLEEIATEENLSIDQVAGFCVAKATFEREAGQIEEADASFAGCLERYPHARAVVSAAIEHYDEQGDSARGNELLADLVEAEPLLHLQRARLARRRYRAGDAAGAHALLRAGTEVEHPVLAAYSWSVIAELLIDEKRFPEAAEAFGNARELEGDFGPQRILAHAELLAIAGESERALALAEELGDHFYRHLIHARVATNRRKPDEALAHLEELLVQWPDNAQAHYYAGRAAERLGDWPRAADAYRSSIRSGAGHTDAGVKLARLQLAAGQYQEAYVAAGHHVKEHGPEPVAVLLALEAATRLSQGQFQASLGQVKDGEFGAVGALLARVANELRGPEAAISQVNEMERVDLENPRDAEALDALAHYMVAAGRRDEARTQVERVLAKYPDEARLHWILSRLVDGDRSERALARALELDPALEPAAVAMGRRLAAAGDLDAGVALIEPFVDESPARLVDIAELLRAAGRGAEAETKLEDLLWEIPHHAEAARQLALLRLARKAGAEPRTLELAQRAVRFRGGPDAYRALAAVHDVRGETSQAEQARAKATGAS